MGPVVAVVDGVALGGSVAEGRGVADGATVALATTTSRRGVRVGVGVALARPRHAPRTRGMAAMTNKTLTASSRRAGLDWKALFNEKSP